MVWIRQRSEADDPASDRRVVEQYETLEALVEERQSRLFQHEMYDLINDDVSLRVFMEYHVFAVWDFMSLVKALQRSYVCRHPLGASR